MILLCQAALQGLRTLARRLLYIVCSGTRSDARACDPKRSAAQGRLQLERYRRKMTLDQGRARQDEFKASTEHTLLGQSRLKPMTSLLFQRCKRV
jgi:hypothetical protein